MKIRKLDFVARNKVGRINKNGFKPEKNELATIKYLAKYGFDIELIKPTNIKKAKNPDILIMGSIWEIKTPISDNKNTIKIRFREASKQANKVIFDLRMIRKNTDRVENYLMKLFESGGNIRRMIMIKANGDVIDILK